MKLRIVLAVCAAMSASAAIAQTQAAQSGPNNNAVNSAGQNNSNAPVAGPNSFTEGQAKSRIENAGYTKVTDLKKDDNGVWRGKGTKAGATSDVSRRLRRQRRSRQVSGNKEPTMTTTISRLYNNYSDAQRAVGDLEAAGVPHSDISIVANNSDGWYSKDNKVDRDHDGVDDRAEGAGKGAGVGAGLGGAAGLLLVGCWPFLVWVLSLRQAGLRDSGGRCRRCSDRRCRRRADTGWSIEGRR